MPKKIIRVAYGMNFLMQAIFSLLCPAGLLIAGGWWLQNRFDLGKWVMVAAIVLGVLTGMYSFFSYLLKTAKHIDPTSGKGDAKNDGRTDL